MTNNKIIKQSANLLEEGLADDAEKLLSALLAKEPNNFHALQLFGLAKHLLGDPSEALIHLEKALKIKPDFSAVRHNIAGIYRTMGHMAKAEENYRRALELKPDYGEAYQGLAEIIRFKTKDPLLKQLEDQIKTATDPDNTSYLHFAAGKIYDDCGEYAAAFSHFSAGNTLNTSSWDYKEQEKHQTALKTTFNTDYFSDLSLNKQTSSPIIPVFIVGMPRSGSTLVEQILATHSSAFGAGEIRDIQSIADQIGSYSNGSKKYPECMLTMPPEACAGLGEAYLNRVATLKGDKQAATHAINKNLFNVNHLGLIASLLPEAHIIHIQRHPLDTCLSCYFQNFSTGVSWSFSLKNIVKYYRYYREMMDHWEKTLPIKILNISYENLVSQPEAICRQLMNYCDLDWEENCLQFYQNRRKVQTASVWQVRQPIYKRSRGRWINYEAYISELIEGLSDYVIDYKNTLNQESVSEYA